MSGVDAKIILVRRAKAMIKQRGQWAARERRLAIWSWGWIMLVAVGMIAAGYGSISWMLAASIATGQSVLMLLIAMCNAFKHWCSLDQIAAEREYDARNYTEVGE